jgi:hypothetical protein
VRNSERTPENDDVLFAAFKQVQGSQRNRRFRGVQEDIPEIPLDLGISLEREELGEDSAE